MHPLNIHLVTLEEEEEECLVIEEGETILQGVRRDQGRKRISRRTKISLASTVGEGPLCKKLHKHQEMLSLPRIRT
jgi:hypothetical protein